MKDIGKNVILEEDVQLGEDVHIGHNVVIQARTKIGDNVRIGHNSVINSDCLLQDSCSVGALVYVRPECVIGRYAFVSPHTKVTTNVLPYSILNGSPARLRGSNIMLTEKIFGREKRDEIRELFKLFYKGSKKEQIFDKLAAMDSDVARELVSFMQEYVSWHHS